MKTSLKRIFLGIVMILVSTQNMVGFSYNFNHFSLRQVATSIWDTVSRNPKTVLGVIGTTLGIAAVYKYFSHKHTVQPEINLPQIEEIPSLPHVELSEIDAACQKHGQLIAPFHNDGKAIIENIHTRLLDYKPNVALNNAIEIQQSFMQNIGSRSSTFPELTLDAVLNVQNNDFAGILWRHHPKFNDTELIQYGGGYWFFYLGSGEHNGELLRNTPVDVDCEKLVQNYKIHLMPQNKDINNIVADFMKELATNELLRQSICGFKVKAQIDQVINRSYEVMPKIVIYPASGKDHAQYVLDVVRCLFEKYQGTGQAPRYNQKVNDLIYFAQGDGDFKGHIRYRRYYEDDTYIYYRSDLTPSGLHDGYHLNFKKPLGECAQSNEFKQAQQQWLAGSVTAPEKINFNDIEVSEVQIDDHTWADLNRKLKLNVTDKHQYSLTKRIIRPSLKDNGTITFLCIHGTFSSANKFGVNLEQPNSQALLEYAQRLAYTHQKSVEMISFAWSGELNLNVRQEAGRVLATMLLDHMNQQSEQTIVYAHSHGCNVASWAAQYYYDTKGKRFNKAIYCASPTSDITFDVLAQDISKDIFHIEHIYHFYGSADVTQALGSFHSKFNFDRKLPVVTNVHNIRLMYGTKDLDHADIKHHVSRNMWTLMDIVDRYYSYHYDLDASVTNDPTVMYVALRNAAIHDAEQVGNDGIDTVHMYSASREQAFKDKFDSEIHQKNIYAQHPWTAFLYMLYGEYNSRRIY